MQSNQPVARILQCILGGITRYPQLKHKCSQYIPGSEHVYVRTMCPVQKDAREVHSYSVHALQGLSELRLIIGDMKDTHTTKMKQEKASIFLPHCQIAYARMNRMTMREVC